MKDGKPGRGVETRRGHVEVVTDSDYIRIRVVCMDYGIPVCPVAVISDPNFRDGRTWCGGLRNYARRREREKENRDRRQRWSQLFLAPVAGVFLFDSLLIDLEPLRLLSRDEMVPHGLSCGFSIMLANRAVDVVMLLG